MMAPLKLLLIPALATAVVACGKMSSSSNLDLQNEFPGVTSITPGDGFSFNDSELICSSACQVNYNGSSSFLSQFNAIICGGDLKIGDTAITCSDDLVLLKAKK